MYDPAGRNGGRQTKVWRVSAELGGIGRNQGKTPGPQRNAFLPPDGIKEEAANGNRTENDEAALKEAGDVLAAGGTVAFPTETVYGLGADARNTAAVERIFAAKGRPSDNPLIVHISDPAQLEGLVTGVNETERRLMDAFWPGPLTLVLPVKPGAVSPRVTAGLDTVAVRMPDHGVALA
ncbi:translation factor, partial [Paenibacillus sp. DMB20]